MVGPSILLLSTGLQDLALSPRLLQVHLLGMQAIWISKILTPRCWNVLRHISSTSAHRFDFLSTAQLLAQARGLFNMRTFRHEVNEPFGLVLRRSAASRQFSTDLYPGKRSATWSTALGARWVRGTGFHR
jgi:hypothetical protein